MEIEIALPQVQNPIMDSQQSQERGRMEEEKADAWTKGIDFESLEIAKK